MPWVRKPGFSSRSYDRKDLSYSYVKKLIFSGDTLIAIISIMIENGGFFFVFLIVKEQEKNILVYIRMKVIIYNHSYF